MTGIADRNAFVTGAGSGLGRALALALAQAGARVTATDISEARAQATAEAITAAGGAAMAVACDVSERAAVAEARAQAARRFGPVSLLFANAGVTAMRPLVEMSPNDVDWILGVNLAGVVHCLEAFLPEMIAAGSGHVVATASAAGLIPELLPTHAPYAAAKGGVIAMMLNLRQELTAAGIGCTVVCPDGIATDIAGCGANRPARFGGPAPSAVSPPEGLDLSQIRFRPPEEVAAMTLDAVRRNRPMVLTDASRREVFLKSYVELVLAAFDEAVVAGFPIRSG